MIQFVWLAHSPLVNIAYLLFRYRLDEVEARRTEYKCLADPRLKERFFRGEADIKLAVSFFENTA